MPWRGTMNDKIGAAIPGEWIYRVYSTGERRARQDNFIAVIRFQLLETEEATLDERLVMEEALLSVAHFSQLEHLLSACKIRNPAVEKAYHIICSLRMLARWAIDRNPCDDMDEYYVALLYNALFTLQFLSLSPQQREHALLSASLLAEKVSQQDEK